MSIKKNIRFFFLCFYTFHHLVFPSVNASIHSTSGYSYLYKPFYSAKTPVYCTYHDTLLAKRHISTNKLNDYTKALLPQNESFVKKEIISSGHENDLWLIDTKKNKYVLRVHKQKTSTNYFDKILKISKEAEKHKTGLKIINSDSEKKLLLMEYVKTTNWPGYDNDPRPYKASMNALKRFHALPTFLVSKDKFIPFSSIIYSVNNLQKGENAPSHLDIALKKIKQIFGVLQPWLYDNSTICHGDFHRDNILVSEKRGKQRFYIIDFDCAGLGHPYFDVVKFSYSLPEHQRHALFCEYLGRTPTILEKSHFELIYLSFLMTIASHRLTLAEKSKEKDRYSKEELEKMLDSKEELPSPFSVPYFNTTVKERQKGAILALHKFLKNCEGTYFEHLLKNAH